MGGPGVWPPERAHEVWCGFVIDEAGRAPLTGQPVYSEEEPRERATDADAEDFLGRSISFTLVFARFWPVWAPRSLPCGLGSAGVAVCATAAVSVPKLVILLRNSRLK